jgi:hypothetical protein
VNLTGPQKEQLRNALLEAFDYPSLRMLSDRMGERLEDFVAPTGGMRTTVFEMIEWAKQFGRLDELVLQAHRSNPSNQKLAAFYDEHLGSGKDDEKVQDPPTPEVGQGGRDVPNAELRETLKNLLCERPGFLPTLARQLGVDRLAGHADPAEWPPRIAEHLEGLKHRAVGKLCNVERELVGHGSSEDAKWLTKVIDTVIPLSFPPERVNQLRESVSGGKVALGVVETSVGAEIVVAAHKGKPAEFKVRLLDGVNQIVGKHQLRLRKPAPGSADPKESTEEALSHHRLSINVPMDDDDWELNRLVGDLRGKSESILDNENRTLYAVYQPSECRPDREAFDGVLLEILKRIPGFMILELRKLENTYPESYYVSTVQSRLLKPEGRP